MKKEKFDITGMSCSACSAAVERTVRKIEGVAAVEVNLLANSMQVEYDETKVSADQMVAAIEKIGYGACPVAPPEADKPKKGNTALQEQKNKQAAEQREMRIRLWGSG